MLVYYLHNMFEHQTVDYKNLIIYAIPPAHYFLVRHTADSAYRNTLHTSMIRAGEVEGAIQQKET